MGNFFQVASLGLNSGAQASSFYQGTPGVNQKVFGEAATGVGLASTGIGATLGINALATGTSVAAAAAGSHGAVAALTSIGPWAALAIPVFILLSKIFKGADPRQVPAAKIEQVFEATAINLERLVEVGMLSKAEAAATQQALIQKGYEYYDDPSVVLGVAEDKGRANMTAVIKSVISQTQALADRLLVAVDLQAARALHLPARDSRKWYPESLAAASQLTDQILQAIPPRSVGDAVGQVGAKLAAVSKTPVGLAGLGLGAFLLVGLLRKFL